MIKNISKKKYFITTPIFYVNSVPHIGHLYSALLADAQSRWRAIKGDKDIIFSTGTDEHGFKIQKKAAEEKIECRNYCQKISDKFKELFDQSNINYTDFIRTTEKRHQNAVEHVWNELNKRGLIYKSSYDGWYSVNDEAFLKENQIEEKVDINGNKTMVSLESGHVVEYISEKNFIFKLKDFKTQLRKYIESNVVVPHNYAATLHSQIDELQDLSISRDSSRISWGIKVPDDPSQTIYVWLDALINYLTVSGYPDPKFKLNWPPDCQVVGKDILRFHAIYWPAFLIALGIELPRRILCHGHWTVNGRKMSKSFGNVIDPFECIKKYTLDGLRYFLLREGIPESDCSINDEKFTKFSNVELANTLGNLYQRCLPFNTGRKYPSFSDIKSMLKTPQDTDVLSRIDSLRAECDEHYETFNYNKVIQAIMARLRESNLLVQEYKPWELIKSSKQEDLDQIQKLLFLVYESLRVCGILLQPIVPSTSTKLLDKLSVDRTQRLYESARVDYDRKLSKNISFDSDLIFKRI